MKLGSRLASVTIGLLIAGSFAQAQVSDVQDIMAKALVSKADQKVDEATCKSAHQVVSSYVHSKLQSSEENIPEDIKLTPEAKADAVSMADNYVKYVDSLCKMSLDFPDVEIQSFIGSVPPFGD
jgi:hypothetical protein